MKDFVHLHTHSHYSLLDGLIKIDELVAEVARLEMPAIALTDHGNMYGAIEFYQKAREAGIQPIIGMEAYIAFERMNDRRPGIDEKRYHLTLLAENDEGYRNLVALTTKAHLEGFYYKPRLDHETLRAHARGLIALSGCMTGEIPRAILGGDETRAEQLAVLYQDIFGKDNFFIELSSHAGIANHNRLQTMLAALAQKTRVPTVATQDAHYVKSDDAKAQDVLLAIQTNTRLDDEDRLTMKDDDFSLRSGAIMANLFAENREALLNTKHIAERVSYNLPLGVLQLPHFPLPDGETAESYLKTLAHQGALQRYGNPLPHDVAQRLSYELDVIGKTGFAGYFLIVQDLVNWAKQQGIAVGPGRGSAAGSLVSYALNITAIDPLAYQLLFERFMNPARISPPDIDLDFADVRKEEVLAYAAKKYGRDHVAQIITFGTMAARAAVRDAGRALGMSYQFCDETAKMIPFGFSLARALKEVKELADAYQTNLDTQKIIDAARRLEGVARHASTHACGVVITKDPLTSLVPLQLATSGGGGEKTSLVTQYEMHAIEDLGLLKIDFLGLANLTIIEETIKRVAKRRGESIDIATIPLDDQAPFALLAQGRTAGIFQFESMGMTRYLKEMKPTHLEDLIAMVALYRPGPMELIPR
ncbi:MAG: DNA polymerase III subunit alpha, partial [Candidatus Sungbacteria bacterium]|nr:DNA polymerase III subunit alpha [Candidatus Sungbacteria bacterium]